MQAMHEITVIIIFESALYIWQLVASLRGNYGADKISLTPSLFIEMPVSC